MEAGDGGGLAVPENSDGVSPEKVKFNLIQF